MSALLVVVGVLAAGTVAVVKALAIDEVRGRLQRYLTARLEATIAALPADLRRDPGSPPALGASEPESASAR
jgi:hypothetical protein